MAQQRDGLTGKVFISRKLEGDVVVEGSSFQLEAVINGSVTRLQADTCPPEKCMYDKRHSGLEIKRALEMYPPTYIVGCGCGYEVAMKDVNQWFHLFGNF